MSVTERLANRVNTDAFAPYVDQALHDSELHARAKKAYASGQEVFGKLRDEPDVLAAVGRLASDEKLQRELGETLADVHRAARRIGRRPRRRRQLLRALMVAAVVAVGVFAASRRTAEA